MKCRLKKIDHLSGNKASVYSVIINESNDTRYGSQIIIIGGGGIKTKETRALQDSPKLKEENYLMRRISTVITQNIISRNIRYSDDGLEFEGELEFTI